MLPASRTVIRSLELATSVEKRASLGRRWTSSDELGAAPARATPGAPGCAARSGCRHRRTERRPRGSATSRRCAAPAQLQPQDGFVADRQTQLLAGVGGSMATPRASDSWTSAATSPETVQSARPPRSSMAITRTLSPVMRHTRASTWSPPSSTTACSAAMTISLRSVAPTSRPPAAASARSRAAASRAGAPARPSGRRPA